MKIENLKNNHTYKQTIKVNQMKNLVLLPVKKAAIETGVLDGQIYRSKRREKIKFPTFTMNLRML